MERQRRGRNGERRTLAAPAHEWETEGEKCQSQNRRRHQSPHDTMASTVSRPAPRRRSGGGPPWTNQMTDKQRLAGRSAGAGSGQQQGVSAITNHHFSHLGTRYRTFLRDGDVKNSHRGRSGRSQQAPPAILRHYTHNCTQKGSPHSFKGGVTPPPQKKNNCNLKITPQKLCRNIRLLPRFLCSDQVSASDQK